MDRTNNSSEKKNKINKRWNEAKEDNDSKNMKFYETITILVTYHLLLAYKVLEFMSIYFLRYLTYKIAMSKFL